MRIKRFTAPDMRAALRLVRDEQGPDAVILSNRPIEGGVEIVAATDYDEALVQQALRTAAPGLQIAPQTKRQDDEATRPAPPATATASAAPATAGNARSGGSSRFEAMMAALLPAAQPAAPAQAPTPALAPQTNKQPPHAVAQRARFDLPALTLVPMEPAAEAATHDTFAIATESTVTATPAARETAAATAEPVPAPTPAATTPAAAAIAHHAQPAPALQLVAGRDLDPAMTAMRDELAAMRQLIEREMGQLVVDRLRGSPARAAAYDALIEAGCDAALAQSIAADLDPTLDPERVHAPMLAQLGQRLRVSRAEPIEDGGVIALIGPTGAGKTTTLAKLAARFAARHRARDVALVTTDQTRAGAREQLQAHGRRLGITVCEAAGPEGLPQTLAQLADYPLVLVDTAGHAARGRAMLGQLAWLRGDRSVRSLLVLPANAHPQDLDDVVRRYRLAAPEGVILTKLDETGRLGAALSMLIRNELSLAYVCDGQEVPADLAAADIPRLLLRLQKSRRAADNPAHAEDRHVVAHAVAN